MRPYDFNVMRPFVLLTMKSTQLPIFVSLLTLSIDFFMHVRFGTTYRSYSQGSRIQIKPVVPKGILCREDSGK
jgi:hypothetical protein